MNNVSFKHSGQLGDIIYSLFTVKALCGDSKKAVFYINLYETIKMHWYDSVKIVYGVDKESYNFIAPLIASQPYIEKVLVYKGERVNYDFDVSLFNYRSGLKIQPNIINYYDNIDYSKVDKWLTLPKIDGFPRFNVLNRTRRYRNDILNYAEVAKKFCFVGLRAEVDFDIPRIPVQNALQLADVLNHCHCFVGNQSLAYAIAWGLGVEKRALEIGQVANVKDSGGLKIHDNEDLFSFCSTIKTVNDSNKCIFPVREFDIGAVDMNRYNKFDEVFYLTNNPDVAKAVIFGGLKSGEEHYLSNGKNEGRKAKYLG
jgi:hypothetical protein